jgi:hypothetical protein
MASRQPEKNPRDLEQSRSERARAGLAQARARGQRLGRPRKLVPTVIARAQDLRASGFSFGKIADALGIGRTTAYRACRAPPRPRAIGGTLDRRGDALKGPGSVVGANGALSKGPEISLDGVDGTRNGARQGRYGRGGHELGSEAQPAPEGH